MLWSLMPLFLGTTLGSQNTIIPGFNQTSVVVYNSETTFNVAGYNVAPITIDLSPTTTEYIVIPSLYPSSFTVIDSQTTVHVSGISAPGSTITLHPSPTADRTIVIPGESVADETIPLDNQYTYILSGYKRDPVVLTQKAILANTTSANPGTRANSFSKSAVAKSEPSSSGAFKSSSAQRGGSSISATPSASVYFFPGFTQDNVFVTNSNSAFEVTGFTVDPVTFDPSPTTTEYITVSSMYRPSFDIAGSDTTYHVSGYSIPETVYTIEPSPTAPQTYVIPGETIENVVIPGNDGKSTTVQNGYTRSPVTITRNTVQTNSESVSKSASSLHSSGSISSRSSLRSTSSPVITFAGFTQDNVVVTNSDTTYEVTGFTVDPITFDPSPTTTEYISVSSFVRSGYDIVNSNTTYHIPDYSITGTVITVAPSPTADETIVIPGESINSVVVGGSTIWSGYTRTPTTIIRHATQGSNNTHTSHVSSSPTDSLILLPGFTRDNVFVTNSGSTVEVTGLTVDPITLDPNPSTTEYITFSPIVRTGFAVVTSGSTYSVPDYSIPGTVITLAPSPTANETIVIPGEIIDPLVIGNDTLWSGYTREPTTITRRGTSVASRTTTSQSSITRPARPISVEGNTYTLSGLTLPPFNVSVPGQSTYPASGFTLDAFTVDPNDHYSEDIVIPSFYIPSYTVTSGGLTSVYSGIDVPGTTVQLDNNGTTKIVVTVPGVTIPSQDIPLENSQTYTFPGFTRAAATITKYPRALNETENRTCPNGTFFAHGTCHKNTASTTRITHAGIALLLVLSYMVVAL